MPLVDDLRYEFGVDPICNVRSWLGLPTRPQGTGCRRRGSCGTGWGGRAALPSAIVAAFRDPIRASRVP